MVESNEGSYFQCLIKKAALPETVGFLRDGEHRSQNPFSKRILSEKNEKKELALGGVGWTTMIFSQRFYSSYTKYPPLTNMSSVNMYLIIPTHIVQGNEPHLKKKTKSPLKYDLQISKRRSFCVAKTLKAGPIVDGSEIPRLTICDGIWWYSIFTTNLNWWVGPGFPGCHQQHRVTAPWDPGHVPLWRACDGSTTTWSTFWWKLDVEKWMGAM